MSLRSIPEAVVDEKGADDELAHACIGGDARAWDELVRRYGPYVYAVATRAYRLEPQVAEDVFQDVWIRIYDGLARYRGDGTLRAWIRQVTISACQEHFRRSKKLGVVEPLEEAGAAPAAVTDLDEALDVRLAVNRLSSPCRSTIEMAFFDDLTQAETARRLGAPEGTVAARVSRCLRRLREDLQEKPVQPPSGEMR
ncbi:MAG TPA: sigma-70 family RNA polymerase sigma factor [Actinomycetota bacterium]|nr:sigma-70 family RNA polymerase sigma factor [Actinomycetota bacterium]